MCDLFDCCDCRHKCKEDVNDREVEELWNELEDVPIDENECLDVDWQGWYKGTHREDIWHWFDEHHSKGVGWLMNEYEPDMANIFKNEVQKLCDMQIALWNDMRNDLEAMDNSTDEEICTMFHKHLREEHHEAVLQLVRVKIAIDKIEKVYE